MSWAQVSRESLGPVSSVVSVILLPVISLTSHPFIRVRVIIWMHIRSVFVSLGFVSHRFWLDRIPSIRTPSLRCERKTVVVFSGSLFCNCSAHEEDYLDWVWVLGRILLRAGTFHLHFRHKCLAGNPGRLPDVPFRVPGSLYSQSNLEELEVSWVLILWHCHSRDRIGPCYFFQGYYYQNRILTFSRTMLKRMHFLTISKNRH